MLFMTIDRLDCRKVTRSPWAPGHTRLTPDAERGSIAGATLKRHRGKGMNTMISSQLDSDQPLPPAQFGANLNPPIPPGDLLRLARAVLQTCGALPEERVTLLADDGTDRALVRAFAHAVAELGREAEAAVVLLRQRQPAFADLPPHVLAFLLASHLVVDLTTVPWLYSDSLTEYVAACKNAGSRLALIWGNPEALPTLLACLPSRALAVAWLRSMRAGRFGSSPIAAPISPSSWVIPRSIPARLLVNHPPRRV
jgi:hypothetical protein